MILIATPAAANANSYATVAEADAYSDSRLFTDDWLTGTADKERALAMATRLLDAFYTWTGSAVTQKQSQNLPKFAFYAWTGTPSTETQALCWPRQGMYSRNGFAIPSGEIPQPLKDATSEFARQLLVADRSADNDIEAQGITSIKAGPVSLTFKDMIEKKVIPDAVHSLLVPSWCIKASTPSIFEVL